MFRGTLTALFLCPPAFAAESLTVHHDAPPNAPWFARIVIHNPEQSGTKTYVLDTIHGPVEVQYFTTGNTICSPAYINPEPPIRCADDVVIRSVPPGVIPSQWEAIILEGDTAEIFLFHWQGA